MQRKDRVLAMLVATSIAATMAARATTVAAADEDQSTGSVQGDSASSASAKEQAQRLQEVVVTGTLLRGVAPIGSHLITMDREQIVATGATDTDQLLANLPQVGNEFNNFKVPGGGLQGGNATDQILRPNLRNLPGGNTSTGPQTLVLVDGHRVVGAGIGELAVDPEIVPPSLIERVEVITDGASAVYGSDAIGGVINIITRKRFSGLRLDGQLGYADGYREQDASVTTGKSWSGGSAFIAYNFEHHDPLFGRQRDWIKQIDWATGVPIGRFCNVANIMRAGGTFATYAANDLTTPGFATCDPSKEQSIVPETYRHNVLAGLDQDISDTVNLGVKGIYSYRHDTTYLGPLISGLVGTSGTPLLVTPANPYYEQIPSASPGEPQLVTFNYGPVLGNKSDQNLTTVESWNITPTLTWDQGRGWQVRAMLNYGESRTSYDDGADNSALEQTAINGTTLTTAIDPYDIAATQNPGLIREIGTSFVNRGYSRDRLTNVRLVADGTPFAAPGGNVHLAVGAEYVRNAYSAAVTNTTTMALASWASYAQSVSSAFAETAVPVFGERNALTGLRKLELSGSVRYDKYNEFGGTTNGKVGLAYEPIEWLALRGNWGQSFNAPTPVDEINAANPTILFFPFDFYPFAPPGYRPPAEPPQNVALVVTSGTVANLKPQTADTWSVGANIRPPVMPGLMLDVSYYRIAIDNLINSPIQAAGTGGFFNAFPDLYTVNPTPQQIAGLLALNPQTGSQLAGALANFRVVSLGDLRTRNLGQATLSGLDFSLSYVRPTFFGSVDASIAGNYQLSEKLQPSALLPAVDALAYDSSLFAAVFGVGATIHDFHAQATLNHSSGYALAPADMAYQQTHIGSFDVVNVFFSYHFQGRSEGGGPSLTLGVYNVLDRAPPAYRTSSTLSFGYANGLSVGRMVQVGISQVFF